MKTYYLGELITQRREKNPGGDLPILGVSKDGWIPPKQKDADTSIYNVFYRNDFVFNPARMELNSIAFNNLFDKAICSSLYEVFYVNRTDLIIPEYLNLIIKQNWFTRYCEFLGSGSAREYCRVANISEIPVEVPELSIQSRAVKYNDVIARRIKLKKKINDNLLASCMAEYMHFFACVPEYHDENSSWYNQPLGNALCRVAMGPFGSNIKTECFVDVGVPVLNGYNISDFILNEDSFRYVTQEKALELKNSVAKSGDIVITHRGTLGQVALIPTASRYSEYVISQSQFMLRCNEEIIIPEYLLFYFHTESGKRRLLANDNTTGVPSIAKPSTYIKNIHVPIPPIELQQQWGYMAKGCIRAICNNSKEIDALSKLSTLQLSNLCC